MFINPDATLDAVRAVYSGPEARLWELLMGEQIHVGGFASSMDLAERAGIAPGTRGVDLCCCTGAGMRFLLRFRGVDHMTGVEATEAMIALGRERCAAEGVSERVVFVLADATDTGLPSGEADFVWGEDAWCYVVDKEKLVAEAVRLVKPGGAIAFTDWVEGRAGLAEDEACRLLAFMTFPSVQTVDGYRRLLEAAACDVLVAEDTGRFAPYLDLYLAMVGRQLTYDVLRTIGFQAAMMEHLAAEMEFMADLARTGKLAQGIFVARRH